MIASYPSYKVKATIVILLDLNAFLPLPELFYRVYWNLWNTLKKLQTLLVSFSLVGSLALGKVIRVQKSTSVQIND